MPDHKEIEQREGDYQDTSAPLSVPAYLFKQKLFFRPFIPPSFIAFRKSPGDLGLLQL